MERNIEPIRLNVKPTVRASARHMGTRQTLTMSPPELTATAHGLLLRGALTNMVDNAVLSSFRDIPSDAV
jgi:hypothetical protein